MIGNLTIATGITNQSNGDRGTDFWTLSRYEGVHRQTLQYPPHTQSIAAWRGHECQIVSYWYRYCQITEMNRHMSPNSNIGKLFREASWMLIDYLTNTSVERHWCILDKLPSGFMGQHQWPAPLNVLWLNVTKSLQPGFPNLAENHPRILEAIRGADERPWLCNKMFSNNILVSRLDVYLRCHVVHTK